MYKSEYELDVRYYETDMMGIVHHSNYVRFFECGRNNMMKELGMPIEVMEREKIHLPVVSLQINYKMPARMGDTLRVVTTLQNWPHARILLDQQIYNSAGEMVCNGSVVVGFLNADTKRPTRAPQIFLEKIAPYFSDEEKNS